MWKLVPYVAAGGAIGATLRFLVVGWIIETFARSFPLGTIAVNILGSLIIGVLAGLADRTLDLGPAERAFLMTGILGGFTTFSAFALDVTALAGRGEAGPATAYVLVSVFGSIAAAFLGLFFVRTVMP